MNKAQSLMIDFIILFLLTKLTLTISIDGRATTLWNTGRSQIIVAGNPAGRVFDRDELRKIDKQSNKTENRRFS
jgi:hypothetical protein